VKNLLSLIALTAGLFGITAPAFADGQICPAGELPLYMTKQDAHHNDVFVAIIQQQDPGQAFLLRQTSTVDNAVGFLKIFNAFIQGGFQLITDESVLRTESFPRNYAITINYGRQSPITLIVTTKSRWGASKAPLREFNNPEQLREFLAQPET